jgi:hypothetical protein
MQGIFQGVPLDKKTFRVDRRWFDKHPHRFFHVRRSVSSEIATAGYGPPGSTNYTIIWHIHPGVRLRTFMWAMGEVQDSEQLASDLWHYGFPPAFVKALHEREREWRPLQ